MLAGLAGLYLVVPLPAVLAQPQQPPAPPPAAQPAPAPAPAAGQPDAAGNIAAPGAARLALPPPPPVHACLQLHNGGAIFNFNVVIDPNVTGFPITSGKITGSLCGASAWYVTGGHLGPNLAITATQQPPNPACAHQLTVAGNFASPSSYTGTYGFPGTGFQQHTLFLGYRAANAACP